MPSLPPDDSPRRPFADDTTLSLFTQKGLHALNKQIDAYVADLVNESMRTMKRHHAESITEAYVQQASHRINSGIKKKYSSLVGSLGGVFLGAAVSSFVDIANATNVIELKSVLIASTMAVVGAIMIVVHFFKE